MAQILVINEEFCWYQGIASLDNYYEIEIEEKILKHSGDVFSGYYVIKGKFTFSNKAGERSSADLLLISKDFTRWIIAEVELASKSLSHTQMQIRVFTDAKFNIDELSNYCLNQNNKLKPFEASLKTLLKETPEVLVIFDSYHEKKLNELKNNFKQLKVCVFEVYKTAIHDFETYRISGDYPYITSGYTYLKASPSSYEIYEVQRPALFTGVPSGKLEIIYKMGKVNALLMVSNKGQHFLKIPRNPFSPGQVLTLAKTDDNKFLIDTLN